jgi:hypothetical protein
VGIRDTLNEKPALATGATIAVVVIALIFIFWQTRSKSSATNAVNKAYYTIDDGQTVFEDDISKAPSFQHQGAQAVQAHMFSCKNGKDPFVGYLERLPDKLPAAAPARETRGHDRRLFISLVKTPKNKSARWVPKLGPDGAAIIASIKCPDAGSSPAEVLPD